MTTERVLRSVVVFAVLLTVSTTTAVATAGVAGAEAQVAAVWQSQIVKLAHHRAGDTLYECRSLQRKLARLLLQVGARERAQFRRFHCGDLSRIVSAEIAVLTPLEATDENLQRLTDYDSREILVARVRGRRLPGAAEAIRANRERQPRAVLHAAWQRRGAALGRKGARCSTGRWPRRAQVTG